MMEFPFPHIEKKEVFNSTFLNEVAFKVLFPIGSNFEEEVARKKVEQLFRSLFNLPLSDENYSNILESRLKVGNSDGSVMFEFSRMAVKISVSQSKYNNFQDSLKPLIEKLLDELGDWYEAYSDVQLKYVDVWPFADDCELTEDGIKDLEYAVFSSELLENSNRIDSSTHLFRCGSDELKLEIAFGVFESKDKMQNSGVALESKCVLSKDISPIRIENVLERVTEMNEMLYDAFHWAVTEDVKKAMRESHD